MTFKTLTALTLALTLLASPALADKGGKGNGNGKGRDHAEDGSHHSKGYHNDDDRAVMILQSDRDYLRRYLHDDYVRNCPPGLAKKNNGCLPPGQAKKRYIIGYPLPHDVVWVPVPLDIRRHLSPIPAGYQYVQVDKDVLLVAEASKMVIDAVTLLSAVGN